MTLIEFESLATEHRKSIDSGDHKNANKLHAELMNLYETHNWAEDCSEIESYLGSDEIGLKLWAAIFSLRSNEVSAKSALNEIVNSSTIHGLTAKTTLKMWEKGLLTI